MEKSEMSENELEVSGNDPKVNGNEPKEARSKWKWPEVDQKQPTVTWNE